MVPATILGYVNEKSIFQASKHKKKFLSLFYSEKAATVLY